MLGEDGPSIQYRRSGRKIEAEDPGRNLSGRGFTPATKQSDFAAPKRFGLVYRDRDNTDKTPRYLHRAPLGTRERFIGFLIEHYAGNFPLGLAPDQACALPASPADKPRTEDPLAKSRHLSHSLAAWIERLTCRM